MTTIEIVALVITGFIVGAMIGVLLLRSASAENDSIKNCDVVLIENDGSIVFKKSFLFGNRRLAPHGGGYVVLEQDGSVGGSHIYERWESIK